MAYIKTHIDVFAILPILTLAERLILACFVKHANQKGFIESKEPKNEQKRKTIALSIVDLTGLTKSHTSEALKGLREKGFLSCQEMYRAKLSPELFLKTRGDFDEATYILPEQYSDILEKSQEFFKLPNFRIKSEDDTLKKQDIANLESKIDRLLNLFNALVENMPTHEAEQARIKLQVIQGGLE